jgi:hypothetical protein
MEAQSVAFESMSPSEQRPSRAEVDRFILESVDSVPHLEALLLLWQNRSEGWAVDDVAKRLWIERERTRSILLDLTQSQFLTTISGELDRFKYRSNPNNDSILRAVADVYRQDMIRISTMIHAKPSSAIRAFARAFRFTKEQE